jgi:glycosyltransferase involved in cell wall biosynthesis
MPIPKLSIGLPVYNGEKYIRCALDSILQQDYSDFELIISDNASQDGTAEICRAYAAKDGRIRYCRLDVNQGASRNFKLVFEQGRGRYFKWAAYDDVCLPGFLRGCVELLDQAPASVALAVPRASIIDEHGLPKAMDVPPERSDTRRAQPHKRLAHVLRTVNWAPGQFGVMRAETLRKTRLVDSFFAADYVLVAELALLGEVWEVPEALLQIRFHPQVSTMLHKNLREIPSWFDPSRKGRSRLSPRARLGLEFARSIGRIPMPPSERLLSYATLLAVWYPREARRMAQEYRNKMAIRTRLRRLIKPA